MQLTKPLFGERLCIKQFTQAHILESYIGWLNDPEVVKFSGQKQRHHNMQSCYDYYDSFTDSDNFFLAIHTLENDDFIGTMTVYFSNSRRDADIGILIGSKDMWGKGIGEEAWNIVMNYLYIDLGINRVTGGCSIENVAMVKIFRNSGMKEVQSKVDSAGTSKNTNLVYFEKYAIG